MSDAEFTKIVKILDNLVTATEAALERIPGPVVPKLVTTNLREARERLSSLKDSVKSTDTLFGKKRG